MKNQSGFSLLEIMCVLVIMGIVIAFTVPRFIRVNDSADQRVIDSIVANLTTTDKLTWSQLRLDGDYINDSLFFDSIVYDIGDCDWVYGPTQTGGILKCGNVQEPLNRTESDKIKPSEWSR